MCTSRCMGSTWLPYVRVAFINILCVVYRTNGNGGMFSLATFQHTRADVMAELVFHPFLISIKCICNCQLFQCNLSESAYIVSNFNLPTTVICRHLRIFSPPIFAFILIALAVVAFDFKAFQLQAALFISPYE